MSRQGSLVRCILTLFGSIALLALFPTLAQGQTFQLQWGSLGATAGQFDTPTGIVVDSAGNVYIADNAANVIGKLDSNGNPGVPVSWAGSTQPLGIVVDASDNLLVADVIDDIIQKYDTSGNFILQFNSPFDVSVNAACDVYVTDRDNSRIQKFSTIVACGTSNNDPHFCSYPLNLICGLSSHGLRNESPY